MSNTPLRHCPTCGGDIDAAVLERMGLRSGFHLNFMCPGNNGPSDGDHLLHHDALTRLAFLEYKGAGVPLPLGQSILLDGVTGNWVELETGRTLDVRHFLLPHYSDHPAEEYAEAVEWVWPDADWRVTYRKLLANSARHV